MPVPVLAPQSPQSLNILEVLVLVPQLNAIPPQTLHLLRAGFRAGNVPTLNKYVPVKIPQSLCSQHPDSTVQVTGMQTNQNRAG
jgi:hypothetical protein